MSNDSICRTKTFNDTHPCFLDERNKCRAIAIEECGLDLEGIPENDQTRKILEAARRTGLSTILSEADAMEVAMEKVGYNDEFDMTELQNRRRLEAHIFYNRAESLIQKMKSNRSPKGKKVMQYIKPSPFHDEEGLGMFYQQLVSTRRAPDKVQPTIQVQIHDAVMALRASPLYQEATPEEQRTIQHVTEDLINGVDPEHCKILETALVTGGAFAAIGYMPIGLGAGLAEGLMTCSEILGAVGLVAASAVVAGSGVYMYMDYSAHANSVRLRMYDYPPIECGGVDFGQNLGDDRRCFGQTRFDTDASGRELPDARGRRRGHFRYLKS